MAVIAWTEIESFHNIKKFMRAYPENLNGNSVVAYRSKVKLHRTNAGVQVHDDGTIIPQSRTTELTLENDNAATPQNKKLDGVDSRFGAVIIHCTSQRQPRIKKLFFFENLSLW